MKRAASSNAPHAMTSMLPNNTKSARSQFTSPPNGMANLGAAGTSKAPLHRAKRQRGARQWQWVIFVFSLKLAQSVDELGKARERPR
ncbi:hypothetical protein OOZ63_23995 [Paucibacter sp. PLA-PC-4]|nr:hypothetical protein [Paucibacter sp. PLA-PC-4]